MTRIPTDSDQAAPGVVTLASPHSFESTVQRLISEFRAHGLKIFALIDQQAEAAAVGIQMWPATLLVFGNARAGTPLMLARPVCGIDLPLKAFVSEAVTGKVLVNLNGADYLVERHSLPSQLSANLAPAERLAIDALRK
jgi:uncharacterized protein (DUF302 family)